MAKLDLEQAKQKVINQTINEQQIKAIGNLKLNKDWKWSVAEQILNKINYDIFLLYFNLNNPKNHKFSPEAKKQIRTYLSEYTFDKFDFGSKRHIGYGNNNPMMINKGSLVEEESFQIGRWTNTTRKPWYSVLFHRTQSKIMYRLPWMNKPEVISIPNRKYIKHELHYQLTGEENFENAYRVSSLKFPHTVITYNHDEHAFEHPDLGSYHIRDSWVEKDDLDDYKKEIIRNFLKRKEKEKQKRLYNDAINNADKVFVTYKDSINAGNCDVRTDIWAKEEQQNYDYPIDIEDTNINGAVLLNKSNSSYVKRAIIEAYNRVFG